MSALAFADPTFESQAAFRRIMRAHERAGDDSRLRRGARAAGRRLRPPPPRRC